MASGLPVARDRGSLPRVNLLRARRAERLLDKGLRTFVAFDLEGADATLREAVQVARASGLRGVLARSLETRYQVLRQRRHFDEAVPLLAELVRLRTSELGPDREETHAWRNELILLLGRLGRYAEAEVEARLRLESRRRTHGSDSLETGYALCTLGWLLREQRRLSDAEAFYRQALHGLERSLGPLHPGRGYALCGLAAVKVRQGQFSEAEMLLARARDLWDIAGRPEMVASVREILTDLYVVAERLPDALALSEKRFGSLVRLSPAEARDRERKLWNLERHAFLLRACGRPGEAERYERRASALRAQLAESPSAADGAATADDPAGPVFDCQPFFGWVGASAAPARGC